MAYTGGAVGLPEVIAKIDKLEQLMRQQANRELRHGAREIAAGVVARRHELLGGSGVPVERAIVEGARVRNDRFVAIQLPGVKPKLSGLRRTNAARAKSLAVAVEWGSRAAQLRNPPRGALVGRNINRIQAAVLTDYQRLLTSILRQYGLI